MRRWAHSQVWHIGVHLLTRGWRYLFPPDPSNRFSPCMGHVTLQRGSSPSTPQGVNLRLCIGLLFNSRGWNARPRFPRASRVSLATFHFYCRCCSATSVSTEFESNSFHCITLKYVSVVTMNLGKAFARYCDWFKDYIRSGVNIVGTSVAPLLQFTRDILHKYSNSCSDDLAF